MDKINPITMKGPNRNHIKYEQDRITKLVHDSYHIQKNDGGK